MQSHPIAITGMHRSGTSMITRGLHLSGLQLVGSEADELIAAADDNPEGFWENKALVACNDDLLEATGGSWDNPPALPPQAVDDPRVAEIVPAATEALARLRTQERWGFKDPRTCLTAPFWLDLEPDLRFVICVRHPLEVALSLKARNQNSYSLGLALWERYYTAVLAAVPVERRIVTHFDTYFEAPQQELARLCAFAGLEPAELHVRTDLRHHTVGITLGEADLSPTLRGLYVELCREAGAALPHEAPTDEGRVRRLVLDGAVARRHADQRQAAIERLQEREDIFRAEHAASDARLRARIRELELQVTRAEALRELKRLAEAVGELKRLATTVESMERTVASTAASLGTVEQIVQGSAIRRAERRAEEVAVRGAKKLVVRPGRRALRRGRTGAVPTAKAVVRRLPAPARVAVERGRRVVLKGEQAARPRAVSAARRLPPPAQQGLRKGRRVLQRAVRDRTGSLPPAPSRPTPAQPKGPAMREWKDAYAEMVVRNVPVGAPWLVVRPGSPRDVRQVGSPKGTEFPTSDGAQPLANDLAFVAQLEALRYAGNARLVLPEGSRPWFRQRAELRGHVTGRYHAIADEPDAGAVYDLTRRAEPGARSLQAAVTELAATLPSAPAVLDWTDLDLAGELPGVTTFRPPAGSRLPYLESSVEVVVVDGGRDHADAVRVASVCVIAVEASPSGTIEVRSVEAQADVAAATQPRVVVWSADPQDDATWRAALADAVADSGADVRFAPLSSAGPGPVQDVDVIVVVEPYVLPLPAAVEAAAAHALADPQTAVAGKVMRADGRLESAGGTVFADRSVGLVASGSTDVRAPWHDYARPVCWGPGFVAVATPLWAAVPPATGVGRRFLREWCSAVWATGHGIRYRPEVAAVRVVGDGAEPDTPLSESTWQRVLDLRPPRPADLGDGEWRYLLANDDVEACRG